jgi:hypothetical protein
LHRAITSSLKKGQGPLLALDGLSNRSHHDVRFLPESSHTQ